MLYAASTGGFYLPEIHGDAIPPDAVEISAEDHAALMAANGMGKVIVAGPGGVPIAIDPPPAPQMVPASVTRTQGLLALLLGAGITEQAIRDKISLITDPTEREVTRLRFEAARWERASAFIAWGATEFALSAEQVDDLFVQAAGL